MIDYKYKVVKVSNLFSSKLKISISLVFFVLATACYAQSPTLGNFAFGQSDWYVQSMDPAPFVSNSSWGYMRFEVISGFSDIYYLNVIANANVGKSDGWIVRNFPLLPGSSHIQSMDFDITLLGLVEEEELSSIAFCYVLDNKMVEDESHPPCTALTDGFVVTEIEERKKLLSSGLGNVNKVDNISINVGKPFGIQVYEEQSIEEISSYHDLPPVREDYMECLPGAFARSIFWLTSKFNTGKSAQDIYNDLVREAGMWKMKENGEYELDNGDKIPREYDILPEEETSDPARIRIKGNYLEKLVRNATNGKRGAITKTWDPKKNPDLCTWMLKEMRTEDVELAQEWKIGEVYRGHIVAVSQIIKHSDGSCTIKYRDDSGDSKGEGQGDEFEDDGGDRVATLKDGKFEGIFEEEATKIEPTTFGVSESLLVEVASFNVMPEGSEINIVWKTDSERSNAGFRLWRAVKNQYGGYTNVTLLEEIVSSQNSALVTIGLDRLSNLINAKGNSRQGASYSYLDTCVERDKTYYYLLEDVDMLGKRTFHWDDIASTTASEGRGCNY